MKTTIFQSVMTALMMLFSINVHAYDAEVDSIFYNLDRNNITATVVRQSSRSYYEGDINIPASIIFNDTVWAVTAIQGGTPRNAAFYACRNLTSVTIPNSVTSIGAYTFYGCLALTSVEIPNSVTSIGNEAFSGCRALTSVEIPNSVTSIAASAFAYCIALASVTFPNSITSVDPTAFNSTAWYTNQDDGLIYVGAIAYKYKGEMPENTSIVIKEGTKTINEKVFAGCVGLTSVTIPNSVTSIGNDVFDGCSSLASITIEIEDLAAWCTKPLTFTTEDSPSCVRNLSLNGEIIKDLVIPNGVTAIGEGAFSGCKDLSSVSIPNSVIFIGNGAFSGCSSLVSVTIPSSVTSINNNMFDGCSSLTSITIEIEDLAAWCTKPLKFTTKDSPSCVRNLSQNGEIIKDLVIPEGATSISENAFANCSGLTSFSIPSSVTSIEKYAFDGCSGLTSITVDKDNPVYDSRDNCNGIIQTATNTLIFGIANTIIPNSVTSINGAFSGCKNLTSINIPNSVLLIGSEAFSGCSNLTSITIPSSVNVVADNVSFDGCENLTSVTINSNNISLNMASAASLFGGQVKDYILGGQVTTIGDRKFSGCSELTSVTISEGVTSIGSGAFSGCSNLTTVNIPSSVTFIGADAFKGTPWYENQPDGVVYVNNVAYAYKGEMPENTSIIIKEGTTAIAASAFEGCSNLTSISIPNSVTFVGGDAFSGTAWYDQQPDGLVYAGQTAYKYKGEMPENTSITIKEGSTAISDAAFSVCSGLSFISIPSSVTIIGDGAFSGCSGLTSVTIPDGVTFIGAGAFYGCKGLTSVNIPEGITSISMSTFRDCTSLTSVNIPDGVTFIDLYAFQNCSGLNSLTIANSVIVIRGYAFSGCTGLTSLTIPSSVTSLSSSSFRDCSGLKSIHLEGYFASSGWGEFYNCNHVTDMYCHSEVVPVIVSLYSINTEEATLHVPAAAIEAYKRTYPWSEFSHIVAMTENVDIAPMEEDIEVAFSENITEETDLTNTVIENVYVTLDFSASDGYDTEEKCIVLASTLTDEQLTTIAGKEIQNADVRDNFNGLILEVPAGKGTISITAQTKGSRILCVKVGDGETQTFTKPERDVVKVPYTTEKDTYVYIYGAESASVKSRRTASSDVTDGVLIYSVKWQKGDATAIDAIATSKNNSVYSIYTIDGRPSITLQKGVNIIRHSDGKVKKVLMK